MRILFLSQVVFPDCTRSYLLSDVRALDICLKCLQVACSMTLFGFLPLY